MKENDVAKVSGGNVKVENWRRGEPSKLLGIPLEGGRSLATLSGVKDLPPLAESSRYLRNTFPFHILCLT
jgi:hypothetical protein